MTRFQVIRTIEAPPATVFSTVSDISEFSKALPHVLKYEFLTESQRGEGTKFRETRLMNGREAVTELEVTEFEENDHVRMVAENHGTIWDTTFLVEEVNAGTQLTMTMDAISNKIFARIMNRLIKGMVQKAVERDMDLVKEYCEKNAQ